MALKKETIIHEALCLLNENGIEGVTLRKLATKLEVQAPALYWHFKNKHALVQDMAEEILYLGLSDIKEHNTDETWQDWLIHVFQYLRKAMLAYTDGGRIVAGAHLSIQMASLSERMIKTLVDAGVTLYEARLIVLTATRFTFGHVIEEQTNVTAEEMEAFHIEDFDEKYPMLTAGVKEYFSSGKTIEDIFNDSLKMIIR